MLGAWKSLVSFHNKKRAELTKNHILVLEPSENKVKVTGQTAAPWNWREEYAGPIQYRRTPGAAARAYTGWGTRQWQWTVLEDGCGNTTEMGVPEGQGLGYLQSFTCSSPNRFSQWSLAKTPLCFFFFFQGEGKISIMIVPVFFHPVWTSSLCKGEGKLRGTCEGHSGRPSKRLHLNHRVLEHLPSPDFSILHFSFLTTPQWKNFIPQTLFKEPPGKPKQNKGDKNKAVRRNVTFWQSQQTVNTILLQAGWRLKSLFTSVPSAQCIACTINKNYKSC